MGNTGIKAFHAVRRAANGIQMSRPDHPAAGSQRKHIPLPAAGAAQPTTPREPWGRCPAIWAAHCHGRLPGWGKDREAWPPQPSMGLGMQGAWMDLHPVPPMTLKSHLAAWHSLLSTNGDDNEGWVVATWVLHTCLPGTDGFLARL